MKFLAVVAALAATALAAPSERQQRDSCTPGWYRCDANGKAIDVCDAESNWLVAGPCPDGTVCEYLPQNGFSLPFCVNPPAEKRDPTPPACKPATYTCANNATSGADGIQVCDTQSTWQVSEADLWPGGPAHLQYSRH